MKVYSVSVIRFDIFVQQWHHGLTKKWIVSDLRSRGKILKLMKEYRLGELAQYIRDNKLKEI